MKKNSFVVLVALLLTGTAFAKLPPASDEAKAKAAETTAKAAHTDKVGSYLLCQSQDRVAAGYRAAAKAANREVKPPAEAPACADPGVFAYVPAPAATPVPTPVPAPAAVQPPLEAAGAHSPPKTAVAPPSTKTPAAEITVKK